MERALEDLLDEYLDRRMSGEAVDLDTLLAQHPELDAASRRQALRVVEALRIGEGEAALGQPDASSSRPADLPDIGPFRIVRELGRGGQAVVYLAEDRRLARRVALKVFVRSLPAVGPSGPTRRDPLARLRREAEIVSRLDHPGLYVVHELGTESDCAWIAMRFVEGETLAHHLAEARDRGSVVVRLPGMPPTASTSAALWSMAELIEKAARALHVAHEAGIVHRDIKPANIMVTLAGDPVILDFGLVQDADSDHAALTLAGEVFGTPAYMAPEQIESTGVRPDRRADVYALGVTLHEGLTLARPFDAPTRESLLRQILAGDLPDPRQHNRAISRDLALVLRTALDVNRDRRYRTALDLAEDLRRARLRLPILARPAGPLLRFRRWVQRSPALATATCGLVLFLAAGLAVALHLLDKERRDQARSLGQSLTTQAGQALPSNPGRALLLAIEGARRAPSVLANQALLSTLEGLRERRTVDVPGTTAMRWAAASSDGSRLAMGDEAGAIWLFDAATMDELASLQATDSPREVGGFDREGGHLAVSTKAGAVQLLDGRTLRVLRTFSAHAGPIRALQFSADGRRLATDGNDDNRARVWDVETGELLADQPLGFPGDMRLDLAPDGTRMALISADGAAVLYDLGERPAALRTLASAARGVTFAPDGRLLLVVPESGEMLALDATTGELRARLDGLSDGRSVMAFSPDGLRVLVARTGTTAGVWELATGQHRFECSGHGGNISWVHWEPGGRFLITGVTDMRVWNAANGKLVANLAGHDQVPFAAVVRSDGASVASAGRDRTLREWTLQSACDPGFGADHSPYDVAFAPTGSQLMAACCDGEVHRWEWPSGRPLDTLAFDDDNDVRSVAFSPDGARVLAASIGGEARLWDARSGRLSRRFEHPAGAWDARFDASGARILTACADGIARIWDAYDGELLRELIGHPAGVRSAAFSPDGLWAVTCSEHPDDASVRVWNLADGTHRIAWRQAGVHPSSVCFDPEGRRILVGCDDDGVRVLDARSDEPLLPPLAEANVTHQRINDVTTSPDGRFIAATSTDCAARVWDARTGELHVTYRAPKNVLAAEFTPDGQQLVAALADGSLRVWPVDLLAAAEALAPRTLTKAERVDAGLHADEPDAPTR